MDGRLEGTEGTVIIILCSIIIYNIFEYIFEEMCNYYYF